MSSLQVLTGRDYVSYSGLTSYLDCGERFRLERVMNVQGEPGYWLAGGTAVHLASERYDHLVWQGKHWNEASGVAHEQFDTSFNYELSKSATWKSAGRKTREWPNGENETWWRKVGHEFVDNYVTWRNVNELRLHSLDGLGPAIEVSTNFTLPGDVTVRAIIDRVFINPAGELVIVDIKTGSRKPPSSLQLGLYATAIEATYGVRPQIGAYWMGRSGELTELSVLDRYTPEMLGRWMRDFRKAVENQVFIPHVTAMCSGCSVNEQCYAYNPLASTPDFSNDLK